MTALLGIALKFVGLSGIGKRGWGALAGAAAILLIPLLIPAVKAKFPWFGTEAQLQRAEVKIGQISTERDELQADVDRCLSTAKTNESTLAKLQGDLNREIERARSAEQQRDQVITAQRQASESRRQQERQHQRELNDALSQNQDWSSTPIPADVRECLHNAPTEGCDSIRDD